MAEPITIEVSSDQVATIASAAGIEPSKVIFGLFSGSTPTVAVYLSYPTRRFVWKARPATWFEDILAAVKEQHDG